MTYPIDSHTEVLVKLVKCSTSMGQKASSLSWTAFKVVSQGGLYAVILCTRWAITAWNAVWMMLTILIVPGDLRFFFIYFYFKTCNSVYLVMAPVLVWLQSDLKEKRFNMHTSSRIANSQKFMWLWEPGWEWEWEWLFLSGKKEGRVSLVT